jgi:hypothetical protein
MWSVRARAGVWSVRARAGVWSVRARYEEVTLK